MTRSIAAVLLLALSQPGVIAEEKDSTPFVGTAEERELVDIVGELNTRIEAYFTDAEIIADPVERAKHYTLNDPAREAVPKLLAFEEKHRGTYPGLMALRCVVGLAASFGEPGSARYSGRRESLERLPVYINRTELPETLRFVNFGSFEPQSQQLFRTICKSPETNATVREFSKLLLAQSLLGIPQKRGLLERRIQELDKGAEPESPMERQVYAQQLAPLLTVAQMQGWEREAVDLLQTVAKSDQGLRQLAVRVDDPQRCLVRLDVERTKTMPLLSEVADSMLFKELHLKTGKAAPEFKVRLVSGKEWALSAQQSKVVIIQFSFKGCGPCEGMYPDLQAIQKEYGPKVSILSIMADEKQSVTEEAVKSGTLTWDVHWDGVRGPLATRWAVSYHPTVYVVDAKGIVAGQELRGKQLKQKIAELVKQIEVPKEPPR